MKLFKKITAIFLFIVLLFSTVTVLNEAGESPATPTDIGPIDQPTDDPGSSTITVTKTLKGEIWQVRCDTMDGTKFKAGGGYWKADITNWQNSTSKEGHRSNHCGSWENWVLFVNEEGIATGLYQLKSGSTGGTLPSIMYDPVYDLTYEPGCWSSIEPMPGAAEALKHLMDEGHEVYIVTSTEIEHVEEKMKGLLFRYFPFLDWGRVIITRRKQMIRGDVLIDDGIHNLEGGQYKKILFTAPHNRYYDAEAHGMIRVNNWKEAVRILDNME